MEIAATQTLSLDDDGTLYELRVIMDGEDTEWVKVGMIDDDHCISSEQCRAYQYLQSEWNDYCRQSGENRLAADIAYYGSRGRF